MSAILLIALLAAQPADEWGWADEVITPAPKKPNVFDQFDPPPETLSPGPHTLVISDHQGMTRIDYTTGAKCLKARNAVRRQVAPPPNTRSVIYGPPSVKAFCVPR